MARQYKPSWATDSDPPIKIKPQPALEERMAKFKEHPIPTSTKRQTESQYETAPNFSFFGGMGGTYGAKKPKEPGHRLKTSWQSPGPAVHGPENDAKVLSSVPSQIKYTFAKPDNPGDAAYFEKCKNAKKTVAWPGSGQYEHSTEIKMLKSRSPICKFGSSTESLQWSKAPIPGSSAETAAARSVKLAMMRTEKRPMPAPSPHSPLIESTMGMKHTNNSTFIATNYLTFPPPRSKLKPREETMVMPREYMRDHPDRMSRRMHVVNEAPKATSGVYLGVDSRNKPVYELDSEARQGMQSAAGRQVMSRARTAPSFTMRRVGENKSRAEEVEKKRNAAKADSDAEAARERAEDDARHREREKMKAQRATMNAAMKR